MKGDRLILKSVLLTLVLFLQFTLSVTTGYALDERDGAWWVEQDNITRVTYLNGIIDGIQLGRDLSLWEIRNRKEVKNVTTGALDTFQKNYAWYFSRTTREKILEGINTLYENSQNRGFPVFIAAWYAARNIVGVPDGEIDPFMMARPINTK